MAKEISSHLEVKNQESNTNSREDISDYSHSREKIIPQKLKSLQFLLAPKSFAAETGLLLSGKLGFCFHEERESGENRPCDKKLKTVISKVRGLIVKIIV